jgi:hypothetical protein
MNINIAITPGSSHPIIEIEFNTMRIEIKKRRRSEEPEDDRKGKRARSIVARGFRG